MVGVDGLDDPSRDLDALDAGLECELESCGDCEFSLVPGVLAFQRLWPVGIHVVLLLLGFACSRFGAGGGCDGSDGSDSVSV